ncbi:MAG: Patatin-like phospholipase [Nitrososphaeraceae archaeon]|jgi:predicted acylesterase/phospholipase RssA|nr:Patatin-like phospholipase [Nitrososphaeraceae archaeon]
MDNNNSNNNTNNFNKSLFNPFLLTSMSLWHQQYATEWIKIYKDFTAYSQKVSESWVDTLWNSWIIKEDDQRRENLRLQNHTDDHNVYKKKKKKMRALILQGGGALGAFQAGAFKALYEKLRREDKQNGNEERPLFDIVAGTSIGAINASLLVSYVIENKSWKGSEEKLVQFWEYLSCPTPDITKMSAEWKKEFDKNNPSAASAEAARRYYSVKEFLQSGVDKVFSPILPPKEDEKFFDPQNKRMLYNKQPLQNSIEKFAKFPIATNYDKGEPRLLVVSTDVAEGTTVTFDSYEKGKDLNGKEIRKIVYREVSQERPIVIEYNDGVKIQHVMASASLPEFYEYEEINGRKFWDGGILSNTPIREVIQAHKEFWEYKIGSKELENSVLDEGNLIVPDLELYIVNLWHSDDKVVPSDPDGITKRHADIKSHDQYYVNESILITHYIDLIEKLIQIRNGKNNYELKKEINKILQNYTTSRDTTEIPKKYIDIIKTQFEITKLESIERRDNIDTISGKVGDFTSDTIKKLIQEGYEATWKKYPQSIVQQQ